MTLFTTIDDRIELLPYFLNYHAKLGITNFMIGIWNGKLNPAFNELVEKLGAWLPSSATAELQESIFCGYDQYCGVNETPWLNRMRLTRILEGDWYAIADLDEFIAFPNGETFQQMQELAMREGCHAVAGATGASFMDRIAESGFPPVPEWSKDEPRLDAAFPLACDITRYCGCGTSKTVMARQDVTILSGHHYTHGHPVLENSAIVHHFKWNSNVVSLLHRRHLAYHAQKLAHAGESAKFMELLIGNGNWRELPGMNTRPAPKLGV